MYKKGELEIFDCDDDVYDSRYESGMEGLDCPYGYVQLPHSCNKWIIGGPEQIKIMIADLQDALKKLGEI
jgi:hypothetical protein